VKNASSRVIRSMVAAQGVGLSVLPHFERAEGIRGLVWRPLSKPRLWSDFALVWPGKAVWSAARSFVHLAFGQLRVSLILSR
jgi:DNA-binding transcriptional LysR family regulator